MMYMYNGKIFVYDPQLFIWWQILRYSNDWKLLLLAKSFILYTVGKLSALQKQKSKKFCVSVKWRSAIDHNKIDTFHLVWAVTFEQWGWNQNSFFWGLGVTNWCVLRHNQLSEEKRGLQWWLVAHSKPRSHYLWQIQPLNSTIDGIEILYQQPQIMGTSMPMVMPSFLKDYVCFNLHCKCKISFFLGNNYTIIHF